MVLAGGEGERLRALTERWLGRHVPKQYCTFVGTRSMLEHTLDRALRISPAERVVTVIAREHASFFTRSHPALASGVVVNQPANRDTAAGVFLALSYVRAADPDAPVVLLPCDHFISPEVTFLQAVHDALRAAQWLDRLVLLGVEPQTLELEYGWIQPGRDLGGDGHWCAHAVEAFAEKPPREIAEAIRAAGALWNTMVVVGPLWRLWALGRRYLPAMMHGFDALVEVIGASGEADVLDTIYETMAPRNFSADFLQRLGPSLAVVELRGATWSDWGKVERIVETLTRLGKRPAFATLEETAPAGACESLPIPSVGTAR